MPYVYADAAALQGSAKVGSRHCVALLRHYAGAPQASLWREGAAVRGHVALAAGTAIATFSDGRYANAASGNHAALYLSQDAGGIWVMDQWPDDMRKPLVSRRYIAFCGADSRASPSNNADRYAVIE